MNKDAPREIDETREIAKIGENYKEGVKFQALDSVGFRNEEESVLVSDYSRAEGHSRLK